MLQRVSSQVHFLTCFETFFLKSLLKNILRRVLFQTSLTPFLLCTSALSLVFEIRDATVGRVFIDTDIIARDDTKPISLNNKFAFSALKFQQIMSTYFSCSVGNEIIET